MNKMADEGYRSSTIYQTRIALYNMLDYAYQNDVIRKNPCNSLVKSNIGKESDIDFEKRIMMISRSMEYRHSVGEWRIGEPKSKSGYRVVPLTEEAVHLLKKQKQKNESLTHILTEWSGFVFLCKKGTPVKNSTYIRSSFGYVTSWRFRDFPCMYYDTHLQQDDVSRVV